MQRSLLTDIRIQTVITAITCICPSSVLWQWLSIFWTFRAIFLAGIRASSFRIILPVNVIPGQPVLDANGNVDKDASRRVEVKFRLKDDEMIEELNKVMTEADAENNAADNTEKKTAEKSQKQPAS